MVFERVYRNKIFSDFPLFFVTLFEKENWGWGGGGPFLGIIVKDGEQIAQNPFSSPKIHLYNTSRSIVNRSQGLLIFYSWSVIRRYENNKTRDSKVLLKNTVSYICCVHRCQRVQFFTPCMSRQCQLSEQRRLLCLFL